MNEYDAIFIREPMEPTNIVVNGFSMEDLLTETIADWQTKHLNYTPRELAKEITHVFMVKMNLKQGEVDD